MSSWYVWAAIGLYPNAGQDFYYIGSPVFSRVAIDLVDTRAFTIAAPAASAANKFMQAARLNGRPLARAYLTHAEIARGGTLWLQMGDRPFEWGSTDRPPSLKTPANAGTKKELRRHSRLNQGLNTTKGRATALTGIACWPGRAQNV